MWKRRDGRPSSPAKQFDAAIDQWVSVCAAEFFFEPYCVEFKPPGPGSIVIVYGNNDTRHRGVEIDLQADGNANIWVPTGGRVFWRPELSPEDLPDGPWETRLQPVAHAYGP
jgi:hypothetical protein